MKRIIYNCIGLLSMAVVMFAGVSCNEETPIDNTPKFPELVTDNDVVPGSELTLTIQPNMAWSISVPKECYEWFKIQDGKFKVQTLSGVSSDTPVEIRIWTTDEESFSLRSCQIKMTMGGETKIIAEYTLRAKEKSVEAYLASKTETGAFEYADGSYVYEDAPMTSDDVIELVWDANEKRYVFPVKVVANFEWSVEWPEWALADIDADTKIGTTVFDVYGVSSRLPMENTDGEISFRSGETVIKTFKVRIPGSKDIFTWTLGGNTSLNFDHAQYFHSGEGSATKDPVQGIMFGPAASRVAVFEKTDAGLTPVQNPWLNVELSQWDSLEGADVLQTRNISISVPKYAGQTDREAVLVFLPATAPADDNELLAPDKTAVKEEYSSNAVSVVQKACPDEYFTFEATETEREASGLLFGRSEETILPEKNLVYAEGMSAWQYNLSYEKEMAVTKSTFYITFPYESVVVYDAQGAEIAEEKLPEHWLGYNPLGDGLYGQILMDMTKFTSEKPDAIDGYIVFKDEQGKVLAAVHCFYVAEKKTEEDVLEDVSSTMFVNPSDAASAGAAIYQVISGPTYEANKELQAPIYLVRYTKDDTSLEIMTSRQCWMYSCPGKTNGPEMVTIDDQMYHDFEWDKQMEDWQNGLPVSAPKAEDYRGTEGILTFGKTSFETRTYPGKSKFNMKRPEGVTDKTMRETIQFGSTSSVLFVFICELVVE